MVTDHMKAQVLRQRRLGPTCEYDRVDPNRESQNATKSKGKQGFCGRGASCLLVHMVGVPTKKYESIPTSHEKQGF